MAPCDRLKGRLSFRSPVSHSSPTQILPPLEEFVRKSNMVHFGDVTVTNHPNTPPIPMTFPMVYLFPVSKDEVSNQAQYWRVLS